MRFSGGRWCLVALVIAGALLLPVPPMEAVDSQEVSGTYTLEFPPDAPFNAVQVSSKVCQVRMGSRFVLDGDLKGSIDVLLSISLKSLCSDWSAPANIHGKGSFVGMLGEAAGSFDVTMVAWHEQDYVAHGKWVIQHADGDLAGLHGTLYFAGFVGWGGTYRGNLHFAP